MKKKSIDFITFSPLALLVFLSFNSLIGKHFTQSAANPDITILKYFCIPLIGFSVGGSIFLGIIRNDWQLPATLSFFIKKNINYIILAIGLTSLLSLSTMAVLRYSSLHTTVLDMGTYTNKIWRISNAYFDEIPYEVSRGHFQPLLLVYGLIYKAFNSTVLLQALQAIILVSGALPLYYIAKDQLSKKLLILSIIFIYFFYSPILFNAALEFHPDHLYVPLILWAYYFAENEKYWVGSMFAAAGGMVKEPLILGTAFFGLYLLSAKKKYWFGSLFFLFFFMLFLIVTFLILPSINNVSIADSNTFPLMRLEENFFISIIDALLTWKVRKLLFIYFLLTPFLFLPLFQWKQFLPAIPFIAIPLLSTSYLHSAIDSQYTVGVIAPAFIAFIFSIKYIKNCYSEKYANAFVAFSLVMTITFSVANGPTFLSINFWKSGWADMWNRSNYKKDKHHKILLKAILMIPEDRNKTVVSQSNVNHVRIVQRDNIFIFPNKVKDADYVILDLNKPFMVEDHVDEDIYMNELQKIKDDSKFQLIFNENNVLLFTKRKLY